MNAYFYSLLALDLARERSREAEEAWMADAAIGLDGDRHSAPRRLAARALAFVSLGSASLARRLDECIADDIGRNIALAE